MLSFLAVVVLGMSRTPDLEENPPIPLHLHLEGEVVPAQKGVDQGNLFYLEAAARFTFPGGDVVSGGSSPKYGDFFGTGAGAGLQADYLWRLSRSVFLGVYVEFDIDRFGGSSVTDTFGTTVRPDSLTMYRALVGAKVREDFGTAAHFYSEQYLGFGVNVYRPVNATISANGMEARGELFSARTTFAFDLGINFGVNVSHQVDLFVGVAVGVNGGPGNGKDIVVVSDSGSTTPGDMVNASLTVGLNIKF
jgi:hypothetical protein